MRNNAVTNTNQNTAPDEILRTTALLYFKDALDHQRYEECADLLKTARKFGAAQDEINEVIAEYVDGAKAGRQNEAYEQLGGRLRYLEEE